MQRAINRICITRSFRRFASSGEKSGKSDGKEGEPSVAIPGKQVQGKVLMMYKQFPSRTHVTRMLWGERMKQMVAQSEISTLENTSDNKSSSSKSPWQQGQGSVSSATPGLARSKSGRPIVDGDSKLPPRRMADSFCQVYLPFATNLALREEYVNVFGGLRFGKFLEDLDALAGSIAYAHCEVTQVPDKLDQPTTKPNAVGEAPRNVIVTASVDRLDLLSDVKRTDDIRMGGKVTSVGKSSMEVTIRIEKALPSETGSASWALVAVAKFIMVARDPKTQKAVFVNPLIIETEEEKLLYQLALENKHRKTLESEMSLERFPPTSEESSFLHHLFLLAMRHSKPAGAGPPAPSATNLGLETAPVVFMADYVLSSFHFCQPQERNIHHFMFGGYLMREAFELAFTSASFFLQGRRPLFRALDDIHFRKSVPVGSILRFSAQVIYAGCEATNRAFQVRVVADVMNPKEHGMRSFVTTNVFYFTFETIEMMPRDEQVPTPSNRFLPVLVPRTYGEAMDYLAGKRRHERGLILSRRHEMDLDSYPRS